MEKESLSWEVGSGEVGEVGKDEKERRAWGGLRGLRGGGYRRYGAYRGGGALEEGYKQGDDSRGAESDWRL